MATSNSALRVSDLDFNSIKDNLKTYLRSQDTFSDYDFEGSGLSVLLDVLAYNTYYNSFYLNMAANESFLDTAQFRQNIVSHAKLINYVPTSAQGCLSKISIKVTPEAPSEDTETDFIVLDKYTRLIGQDIDGTNYPFVTINANTASKDLLTNSFTFSNVYIKQGEVITHQYEALPTNFQRRFQIPSANVDTTTVVVTVQQSSSNTDTNEYVLFNDITEITSNSMVYFIEEDENLFYTIYFGDDVIGKKPEDGSVITVTYLDTVGSIANNISNFSFTDKIAGLYRSNIKFTSTMSSYGGTDKETEDQVRFRAPQYYTTQNRAVTVNDYESIITKDYNNIDAVSVWGGEDHDPVVYGKVYLSLKTKGYYTLTNLEKENIKNSLILNRNVLTVIPEIVDPDYCYVLLRGYVTYNPSLTMLSRNDFLNTVRTAIVNYSQSDLNTFKSTFKKSKLQYYIENSEKSITGSDIYYYLQKQSDIETNVSKNYEFLFNTILRKGDSTKKLYSFPAVSVPDSSGISRNVFIEEVPESFTGIGSVDVVNSGINYSSTPIVTITGDGIGATAVAEIVNGKVRNIKVTNKGSNYTRATVAITGGGGSEARAEARVETNYGTLRTYYYRSNGEKIIVNENVGTIDYLKGKVTLVNFAPTYVARNSFYATDVLTINVVPEGDIVSPLRNRILTVDLNDTQSIQIDLVPES